MKARAATIRRTPLPVGGLAVLAVVLLMLPLVGLVAKAPWSRLPAQLSSGGALDALRLSMITSTASVVLCLLFGVPLAWVLARSRFRGRSLLRSLVTLPLVLPPVVGGVALLLAFGRAGLLGGALSAAGIRLPFSTAGVVLAETFVALPFLVLSVEGALAALDERYEQVAATLGARPWAVFRRVTLPIAGPALAAGAALSWARTLGEFGATITFAGNLPGTTQTLPLYVYLQLQTDPDAAVAMSLVLLVVSVAVLIGLRGRWAVRR